MKLTSKELMLAVSFAIIGFLVSMKEFLLFLNGLNPLQGFLVYYGIVIFTLTILSYFGLVIFNIKIEKFSQVLGASLIVFVFFLIFNWTNPLIQAETMGADKVNSCSATFTNNSEDGIVFYFWNAIVGVTDLNTLRILVYPITAFVLTLIGGFLVENKVKLSP